MSLNQDFDKAFRKIMVYRGPVDVSDKLALYGLFNQAKRGDCKDSQPLDSQKMNVQKFEAWMANAGLSKVEAKTQYVDLAYKILKVGNPAVETPKQRAERIATASFKAAQKRSNTEVKRAFSKGNNRVAPKFSKAKNKKKKATIQKPSKPNSVVKEAHASSAASRAPTNLTNFLQSNDRKGSLQEIPPNSPRQKNKSQNLDSFKTMPNSPNGSTRQIESPYKGLTKSRTKAPKTTKTRTAPRMKEKKRLVGQTLDRADIESVGSEEPELPDLPRKTPGDISAQYRQDMFRSRHFSSVTGVNPVFDIGGQKGDIGERYELYDKIRHFYSQVDPSKLTKGIGMIVEWTMMNGVGELNVNLTKKYGKNLKDMERAQSADLAEKREQMMKNRNSQIALSQRLMQNKDPDTKKKVEKLTRFLLVNDPELVSRGMYLMMKFIETKGLGALNENLKSNYGKSLDAVTDDELNAQLKQKYGNDLGMLNNSLMGMDDEVRSSVQSVMQDSLQTQMMNLKLDPSKLQPMSSKRGKTTMQTVDIDAEVKRQQRRSNGRGSSRRKPRSSAARSKNGKKNIPPKSPQSPDRSQLSRKPSQSIRERINTTDLINPEKREEFDAVLRRFLRKFEPKRFENALDIMLEFTSNDGITELNKKLTNKYGVNLEDFEAIPVETSSNLTSEEFQFRLLQFVNKHETADNIDRAVSAMTKYERKHGIEALNTKLYMKYGQTLNDFGDSAQSTVEDLQDVNMLDLHKLDLSPNMLEKLKSYYVKYDPMVLAEDQVDKIFEWAKRNGEQGLDRELKKKYGETLTEFIESEERLRKELLAFYKRTDDRKVEQGFDKILQWALVNGREALNFNLRKKYNRDLDTDLERSATDLNDVVV